MATILDGITADIGETLAIVIRGDGPNGVFIGRLASVSQGVVTLVLTTATNQIPAGTIIAIDRGQIVAAARVAAAMGTVTL